LTLLTKIEQDEALSHLIAIQDMSTAIAQCFDKKAAESKYVKELDRISKTDPCEIKKSIDMPSLKSAIDVYRDKYPDVFGVRAKINGSQN